MSVAISEIYIKSEGKNISKQNTGYFKSETTVKICK
jgi:hypothetical protein